MSGNTELQLQVRQQLRKRMWKNKILKGLALPHYRVTSRGKHISEQK